MRRPALLAGGVVLILLGVLWTLQGLDLLGQAGGMNGQPVWAVIGQLVALAGVALVVFGRRRT